MTVDELKSTQQAQVQSCRTLCTEVGKQQAILADVQGQLDLARRAVANTRRLIIAEGGTPEAAPQWAMPQATTQEPTP